jgi:hypothetical protein
MPDAGFVDELTDWHNLLQGALGSFVGSILGVIGAVLAALWAVQRQIKLQESSARQQLAREKAKDVQRQLNNLRTYLLSMSADLEVGEVSAEALCSFPREVSRTTCSTGESV